MRALFLEERLSNAEILKLRRMACAVAAGVGLRRDLADEVAQRTLLALLESGLAVNSPSAWVYAVARRTSIKTARRESRYVPADGAETTSSCSQFEERLDVQRAWSHLTKSDRQVLLHRAENFSVEKTAALTGLSPSTVKRRLRRGRRILARVF